MPCWSATSRASSTLWNWSKACVAVCVDTTTTRTLLWTVARAIEHHNLLRESRRLLQAERHRLAQEQLEAERLLAEQWAMVRHLDTTVGEEDTQGLPKRSALPQSLGTHYRELLRAQVIMGTGNLNCEMSHLADVLVKAHASAQQVMQLHVETLEELIRGLGNRSARHVMTRADLLLVEVLLYLAAGYRQQSPA
jgi:hypothetical protein